MDDGAWRMAGKAATDRAPIMATGPMVPRRIHGATRRTQRLSTGHAPAADSPSSSSPSERRRHEYMAAPLPRHSPSSIFYPLFVYLIPLPRGCGEIGRHARLRILCREACGFKSLHPHFVVRRRRQASPAGDFPYHAIAAAILRAHPPGARGGPRSDERLITLSTQYI